MEKSLGTSYNSLSIENENVTVLPMVLPAVPVFIVVSTV